MKSTNAFLVILYLVANAVAVDKRMIMNVCKARPLPGHLLRMHSLIDHGVYDKVSGIVII